MFDVGRSLRPVRTLNTELPTSNIEQTTQGGADSDPPGECVAHEQRKPPRKDPSPSFRCSEFNVRCSMFSPVIRGSLSVHPNAKQPPISNIDQGQCRRCQTKDGATAPKHKEPGTAPQALKLSLSRTHLLKHFFLPFFHSACSIPRAALYCLEIRRRPTELSP